MVETVDIDIDHVDYDKETKHAHYVVIENDPFDGKSVWLPKSQIESIDDWKGIITIPEWLAEEKELI